MSLTAALNTALSGLTASTTAAQIISGNVSNAQTAGYTEKTISVSEITEGTSLGGVAVTGYNRVSDSVLSATLNNATSTAGYLSTQDSYMSQVQSILDSSESTPALASAVSKFQSALTAFANAPEDVTVKKSLITAGQQLTSTVTSISSAAASLQTTVQSDLSSTVASLNADLAQVQKFNTQIATAQANSQPTGDLEDQRDNAINAIAAITNVTVMSRANGGVALYTSTGTALLDGQAQVFTAGNNTVTNAVGADVSGSLTGGKLQAETDFLSTSPGTANGVGVITKLQSQLQNFANIFVSAATGSFASTYNSASTAAGEQASGFFTASIDPATNLPDLSTFQVNASLIAGTTAVKQAAATGLASMFTSTSAAINPAGTATSTTFTSTGLTVTNETISGIANSILSGFQQMASTISSQSSTATTQQSYYQSALSSATGVNTDTELVNLTNWQNSYAASAHVISTLQAMFSTLENMVG